MKLICSFLILTLISICSFSQSLDLRYTPYLYLGASKDVLIALVVEQAKSFYRNDVGGVFKQQKKLGVNLKKKKALEAFLVAMDKDMTRQLKGTNDWSSGSVNFRSWIYPIEELVGDGFNLPGFSAAKRDKSEYEMVTVYFKNNKVSGIYTTITITSPSGTIIYPYNNNTLDIIHQIIVSRYGSNVTHSTKNYENFLGERAFPAAELSYVFSHPYINYFLGFSFLPYGQQDKAGNWTYKGSSWQRVTLSASLK